MCSPSIIIITQGTAVWVTYNHVIMSSKLSVRSKHRCFTMCLYIRLKVPFKKYIVTWQLTPDGMTNRFVLYIAGCKDRRLTLIPGTKRNALNWNWIVFTDMINLNSCSNSLNAITCFTIIFLCGQWSVHLWNHTKRSFKSIP